MSEPSEASKKIKVVDRRRFDETGDLRPDAPPTVATKREKPVVGGSGQARPAAPPAAAPARPESGSPAAASGATATSPLFLDLVAGLAQQAEILISGGQGLPAQPAEAQRIIDYLAMLESKTRGNLSAEEKQILSNVIFQLRTLYVQQQR